MADRHQEVPAAGLPLTFVGSQDVTLIAGRVTDERHLAHALVVLPNTGDQPRTFGVDDTGPDVAESTHDGYWTVPGYGWTVLSSGT